MEFAHLILDEPLVYEHLKTIIPTVTITTLIKNWHSYSNQVLPEKSSLTSTCFEVSNPPKGI
jgi:hypothetical protein